MVSIRAENMEQGDQITSTCIYKGRGEITLEEGKSTRINQFNNPWDTARLCVCVCVCVCVCCVALALIEE